jgi:hypothetical protein
MWPKSAGVLADFAGNPRRSPSMTTTTATYVRSAQRLAITIIALVMGPMFVLGPWAGGIAALVFAPPLIGIPVGLLLMGLGGLFAWLMSENFAWVEIDGPVIRGRRFWTRILVEQRVEDITQIKPLFSAMGGLSGLATDALLDAMLGTNNRGYMIQFRTGPRITLIRADMTNVDPFLVALHQQLGPRWNEVVVRPPA